MPEGTDITPQKPQVGNLTDFVEGAAEDNPLYIEVAVKDNGKVLVFYDKPFREEISWFEYDTSTSRLDFIVGEGEIRDAGVNLVPEITKHMQNAHQILTILMDDSTGEPIEGEYVPLIIHTT